MGDSSGGQPSGALVFTQTELDLSTASNVDVPTAMDSDSNSSASSNAQSQPNPDRRVFSDNLYNVQHRGPYTVHVLSVEGSIGRWHPNKMGRILFNHKITGVVAVKRIARNKAAIDFVSSDVANSFLKNSILTKEGLTAFIPFANTQRIGVVRNIDPDIPVAQLLDHMGSDVKISKIIRIHKKSVKDDGSIEHIPTWSVKVYFVGNILPPKIVLYYTVHPVDVFIPYVIQCKRCLRFGHVVEQCKGKERCIKCGLDHTNTVCEAVATVCINCQASTHIATFKECPEYLRQQGIKRAMALENLPYHDVFHYHPELNSPKYKSQIAKLNHRSFPPLRYDSSQTYSAITVGSRPDINHTNRVKRYPDRDYDEGSGSRKRKFTEVVRNHGPDHPRALLPRNFDYTAYNTELLYPNGRRDADSSRHQSAIIHGGTSGTSPAPGPELQSEGGLNQQGMFNAIDGLISLIKASPSIHIELDYILNYIKGKFAADGGGAMDSRAGESRDMEYSGTAPSNSSEAGYL